MPSKNLGQVAAIVISANEPNNKYVVWFDLGANTLKYYNFSTLIWEPFATSAVIGQIKLQSSDSLGYLIDKIDSSLQVSGGLLGLSNPVSAAEKAKWNGQTTTYFVNTVSDLGSLTPITGDRAIVADDGDGKRAGYYWTGSIWNKDFDPDWENINLLWSNITGVPNATEGQRGIIQLASAAETFDGVNTEKAVTPATLQAKKATISSFGIIEIADNAETQTGTDNTRAVSPQSLSSRTATETRTGLVELATNAEVQAGTDTERAVTPAGLESKTATESRKGIAAICQSGEILLGVDDEKIVTAKKIKDLLSSTFGTTTLVPYAGMPTTVTDGRVSYLKLGKLVFIDAQIEFNVNAPNDSFMFKNTVAVDYGYLTPARQTAFGGEIYVPGTGWVSCIFEIYILTTNLVVEIKTYNGASVNINTGYSARFNGVYRST